MLPYLGKLGVGWAAVAVLFLGSTFGIKQTESSPYKWRVVSLVGMAVMYGACWIMSSKRRAVRAQPIILGLCMQMIFGLLVFKTGAGLSVITWLALAASDLLESGIQGECRLVRRMIPADAAQVVPTFSGGISSRTATFSPTRCRPSSSLSPLRRC